MIKKYLFAGFLSLFVLGACNHNNSKHAHHNHEHTTEGHHHGEGEEHHHDGDEHHHHEGEAHHHEGEHHESTGAHGDEIILPKAKADASGVKVTVIAPSIFRQVIQAGGEVLAAQGDESVAVATTAGIVSFRNKITEGMSMNRGTPLVSISASNLAEGDPAQRARIAYEAAHKEYERMKELVQSHIVSDKEFIQAEQTYQQARLSYEAVSKGYSSRGRVVTAPISGYVKSILVKEGDYVNVGQPIASITQNRRLFLRAQVSEKYYPYLHTISSANFRTPYNNKVYELAALNGRLLSSGKAAGEQSFSVPVTFEFDNKGDVIPGSFVEVFLLASEQENVISVPRTALTEEQGLFFVYVQVDGEGYRKQEVTIGADNGKSIQLLTGVKTGDRVVTEGAYQVKLAGASNAIPAHSHEH